MTEEEAKPKRKRKMLRMDLARELDKETAEYEGRPWPPPLTDGQREMISQIAEIAVDEYIDEVDVAAEGKK